MWVKIRALIRRALHWSATPSSNSSSCTCGVARPGRVRRGLLRLDELEAALPTPVAAPA